MLIFYLTLIEKGIIILNYQPSITYQTLTLPHKLEFLNHFQVDLNKNYLSYMHSNYQSLVLSFFWDFLKIIFSEYLLVYQIRNPLILHTLQFDNLMY